MIYTKFEQLTKAVASRADKARCAIVAPEDEHTIDAVIRAYREGLIEPILIGSKDVIGELLAEKYFDPHDITIIDETDHEAACQTAVDLVNRGQADAIMKGLVHTKVFMHAILKREIS